MLTFDHLTPRCKGGQTTWENVITACSACNLHKADKTVSEVGLTLARLPFLARADRGTRPRQPVEIAAAHAVAVAVGDENAQTAELHRQR